MKQIMIKRIRVAIIDTTMSLTPSVFINCILPASWIPEGTNRKAISPSMKSPSFSTWWSLITWVDSKIYKRIIPD